MRTVYLGTSQFAAAILGRLAESVHAPVLVLTRPDRPKGRGRQLASPPVAETARALGLPVEQPANVNDLQTVERIEQLQADAVIVCAFGALIREPLLSHRRLLNVHPSLLPRWRGAAPIERAIMAGDQQTGVSIMRLTEGLDSGPVCLAESIPIEPHDTYGTLSERLQHVGARLLLRALDDSPSFVAQPQEGVTYAEKIGPHDRTLDPARMAIELERTVRALNPHIGARLALDGASMLGVRRAVASDGSSPHQGLYESDGHLMLGCAQGVLELLEVQPAGGRPMDGTAYLRGHGLPGR